MEIRIVGGPHRYVSGEETAVVSWLNGGDAKPMFTPPRPFERGVAGRPTLVQNVETLSDLALIGRFGADWYRSTGTAEDPGTTLVTLSGGVSRPGVYEVPLGSPLGDVVAMAGIEGDVAAVLVGGYFGSWVPAGRVGRTSLGARSLREAGGGLGAGVVFVLPNEHVCGLAESARVARWLADENAGQCGPCVNGLDAIARRCTCWSPATAIGEPSRSAGAGSSRSTGAARASTPTAPPGSSGAVSTPSPTRSPRTASAARVRAARTP